MFKSWGTAVRTWHASIAHKRLTQQPVPEEAAPDSPAADFGTIAEIRHRSDYSQSPQTSNSKRKWGPEDSPGLAGHARASGRRHRDANLNTRSCPRCGISTAPAQGTNLSPASPPREAAAPAPRGTQTPPGREPKPAHQPKRQVSHKDTTSAPHEDCSHPGERSSRLHRLG